jgi:hypothetical protein
MSGFVFIVVLIISYFIVKIGAAAFELTGLGPELAHFQSLSAFTGTGFTTKESELITAHKQRRRIVSVLMILGKAGFVTLIATLVTTISPDKPVAHLFPFIDRILPDYLIRYVNLAAVLLALFIVYRLFHSSRFSKFLMAKIQQKMVDKKLLEKVKFEELLLNAQGYGISQIEVTDNNPLSGKSLLESSLRSHDILVLSIDRAGEHLINPVADFIIRSNDKLVCFGKLENIRKVAYEDESK